MAHYHLVYADSAYRNTSVYTNSNSYSLFLTNPIRNIDRVELVSAWINTSGLSNTFVFLDIAELRTPYHQDARQLAVGTISTSNTYGSGGVAGASSLYSFAPIPLDVPSGSIKYYKESADFKIEGIYPSRLDSLSRLTINWTDIYGNLATANNVTGTGCVLRVHTRNVPIEKSILHELPPPVPLDPGPNMALVGALLVAGLLLILFVKNSRDE
jgi:hypothetical protein